MLVPKQMKICSHSLHKNGSLNSQRRKIVLFPNHQHGRLDVMCNQPMGVGGGGGGGLENVCNVPFAYSGQETICTCH